MPTITKTYPFASDLSDFTETLPDIDWIAGDGQPAAGCAKWFDVVAGLGFTSNLAGLEQTLNWEAIGVPAGATVSRVDATMQVKPVTLTGITLANVYTDIRIGSVGGSAQYDRFWLQDLLTLPVGAWAELSGGFAITGPQSASDYPSLTVSVVFNYEGNRPIDLEVRFDTLVLTVTYEDGPGPIGGTGAGGECAGTGGTGTPGSEPSGGTGTPTVN